ncbi:hypothetical protein BRADI_4g40001v3 [Brachypodium distachyon]|uniref:Uncharacterized protein n=1 Tax=Brachypodium distachyon TaxID=15368 RepID=A0A2K2CTD7_BRADI|nr:hypothetical protein BRADI_4g40001v3 [Brachypodium distachyon]
MAQERTFSASSATCSSSPIAASSNAMAWASCCSGWIPPIPYPPSLYRVIWQPHLIGTKIYQSSGRKNFAIYNGDFLQALPGRHPAASTGLRRLRRRARAPCARSARDHASTKKSAPSTAGTRASTTAIVAAQTITVCARKVARDLARPLFLYMCVHCVRV